MLIRGLLDFEWREESPSAAWRNFFPDVPKKEPDNYRYPCPLTDDFWALYAEHIYDFVDVATAFRNAVLTLGQWEGKPGYEQSVIQAIDTLNALVTGVMTVGAPMQDGTIEQQMVCPSLLSSFAMMALQDLTARHHILRCLTCSRLFITRAY